MSASSASAATSHCRVICHLTRRERHRNLFTVTIAPPKEATAWGMAMTPTGQRDSMPVPSQEDRLLELLRKAEGYAYALAHGYDIGGHPNSSLWARGPGRADTRYLQT